MVNANGHVSRRVLRTSDVAYFLRCCAVLNGYQPGVFKSHSFRSGGATEMVMANQSDETINHTGRWASNSTSAVRYRRPKDRCIGALSKVAGTGQGGVTNNNQIRSAPRLSVEEIESIIWSSDPFV
jgi:hypothetical protein